MRSRVSVIVNDYAKSPIGSIGIQEPVTEEKPKSQSILPADIEDRLKYVQLNFTLLASENFLFFTCLLLLNIVHFYN